MARQYFAARIGLDCEAIIQRFFDHFLLESVVAIALCMAAAGLSAQSMPKSAEQGRAASASRTIEVAAGKAVYEQRCAICHFSDSVAKKIGPGMKGLYARGKFSDGQKVNDARLIQWIEEGGVDMPGFRDVLKPGQIRALMAYLKSL